MRKINTRQFYRGRRSTSREINRKIVLNLVREHQPLSRADLARHMGVNRGISTDVVNERIATDMVGEGATANTPRGRKPLHVRTRGCGGRPRSWRRGSSPRPGSPDQLRPGDGSRRRRRARPPTPPEWKR